MESDKPFTYDMKIYRGEKRYQEISVTDDYDVATTFTPLSSKNGIPDGVSIITLSNPVAFVPKGLHITDTTFISFTTLMFLVIALIVLASVLTYFFVKSGNSVKTPLLSKV